MRRRYYINQEQPLVKYGYLYNWYVTQGTGDNSIIPLAMANEGWVIPYHFNTMKAYLGGDSVAGGKLKENNTDYWNNLVGATNDVNFSARGGGHRQSGNGAFTAFKLGASFWCLYTEIGMPGLRFQLTSNSSNVGYSWMPIVTGCSIRLVRPLQLGEQTIPDGQPVGTYIGNDGFVYPTVRIGSEVWLACNLAETMLRNGTLIPVITDNTQWASQTGKAMCYQQNDFNNVFI